MLEIMNALVGGSGERPVFTVTANKTSIDAGEAVDFTISHENVSPGTRYFWTLEGRLASGFVQGSVSGTFLAEEEPTVVRIRSLWDEALDDVKDLRLHVRSFNYTGYIVATSPTVNVTYTRHPTGQQEWIAVGSHEFVVPEGVLFVSAVAIGGGQGAYNEPRGRGGDGADLRWRNRIPVTPGETLTIKVGAGGVSSTVFSQRQGGNSSVYRGNEALLEAAGGANIDSTPITMQYVDGRWQEPTSGPVIGGGDGGEAGAGVDDTGPGGGGGAGGYLGNGGRGGNRTTTARGGQDGSGAAGGGAYYYTGTNDSHHATAGGGVGLQGRGRTGDGGARNDPSVGGQAGSGGVDGTWILAGLYGGGARGRSSNNTFGGVNGANGAVRLIWGPGRGYPSTLTSDM